MEAFKDYCILWEYRLQSVLISKYEASLFFASLTQTSIEVMGYCFLFFFFILQKEIEYFYLCSSLKQKRTYILFHGRQVTWDGRKGRGGQEKEEMSDKNKGEEMGR